MSFKTKQEHIHVILNFMTEHKQLASGRLSVANGKDEFKRLWANLTLKLNALGYGAKTTEKWQKTWSDYKGNLKKKASDIKRHELGTGGGPPIDKKLSELEIGVLNLLGKSFYEGCGTEEKGLEHTKSFCNPSTSSSQQDDDMLEPKEVFEQLETMIPSTSIKISTVQDNVAKDHSYLPSNSLKRRQGKKRRIGDNPVYEGLYEESLNSLHRIENIIADSLCNINTTLNDRLKDIADAMSKKCCNCGK